jgi:AcrR family transcriptional regulator
MLRSVADAVAEKGFAWVTVADIISRAGVSRETFYEHFSDKEECFIAALDEGARALLEILGAVVATDADDPVERLDRVLKAYLNTLAGEPAFAKAFLIDAYGAGPRAIDRRIELQRRFIELVAEVFDSTDPESLGRFACEALVASISSMVTVRVGDGKLDELPALREPIIALVRRLFAERVGAASPVPTEGPSAGGPSEVLGTARRATPATVRER